MATGYPCIEYDKDRKGNTLDTPIVHVLKRMSIHEETNGKHYLRYNVSGKSYYLFFEPDGVDFIVVDDADNPDAQAQRIYQTQMDGF